MSTRANQIEGKKRTKIIHIYREMMNKSLTVTYVNYNRSVYYVYVHVFLGATAIVKNNLEPFSSSASSSTTQSQ